MMNPQLVEMVNGLPRPIVNKANGAAAGGRRSTALSIVPPMGLPGYQLPAPRPRRVRPTQGKQGTLRLDQGAYSSPQNDLPGITPLHLNENLFAAARHAAARLSLTSLVQQYIEQVHLYPTGGTRPLQNALAATLHIAPEKLVITQGSAALLRDLVLYLLRAGDTLLVPAPSWSFYDNLVTLVGARVGTFRLRQSEDGFAYDRGWIAAAIEAQRPKVVLLCSPNNPTGNVLPLEDFFWLVQTYPGVDFILDEAYYGFHPSYTPAQEQQLMGYTNRENVFVVRTFSKYYGLANSRIGFVITSAQNGRCLQKIAPVFGIPSLDQMLAASRLNDEQFQVEMQQEYAEVNEAVYTALQQIPGFTPYQTRANFILVQHDERWWGLEDRLLEHGFKIKRETILGSRNYFRITYADLATMTTLLTIVRQLAA